MPVRIERYGNRIHIKTPWTPDPDDFEEIKEKCKKPSGARFRKKDRCWAYPLDWGACLELREVWGNELVIGPELESWARKEKRRRSRLRQVGRMTDFDLQHVQHESPVLAEAMRSRTYQRVGSAFASQGKAVLIADEPGLGKTLVSIGGVLESRLDGPVLVVAPAPAVTMTWAQELLKWVPDDGIWCCSGTREKRYVAIDRFRHGSGRRWLVVNPEMLEVAHTSESGKWRDISYAALWEIPWAHIIVDESHDMLITRTAKVKDQPFVRQGLGKLKARGLRIAMSGTPFRGHLENAWGTLNWLKPDLYTSFWRWVERWFDVWDDSVRGTRVIGGLKAEREKEFYREFDALVLRRTKAEVAPDLPPKAYAGRRLRGQNHGPSGIWLSMTAEQERALKELRHNAAVNLDGGTLLANGVLAELTRARQFAVCSGRVDEIGNLHPALPSNKFDWLVWWLAERGITKPSQAWGDSKVLVCSQFSSVLSLFAFELTRLGIATSAITGRVKGADRVAAKNAFQGAGGPRVMLLTTKAGGVSLTLDAADDVIFLDETWVPDDQEQVEDRIHRVSRIHRVTIWYLRSLGSIEHTIATSNLALEDIQKALLDTRRGAGIARQLLLE